MARKGGVFLKLRKRKEVLPEFGASEFLRVIENLGLRSMISNLYHIQSNIYNLTS